MLPFTPATPWRAPSRCVIAHSIPAAVAAGAHDRKALLSALRAAGPFDEHGDPVDPPAWLNCAGAD